MAKNIFEQNIGRIYIGFALKVLMFNRYLSLFLFKILTNDIFIQLHFNINVLINWMVCFILKLDPVTFKQSQKPTIYSINDYFFFIACLKHLQTLCLVRNSRNVRT